MCESGEEPVDLDRSGGGQQICKAHELIVCQLGTRQHIGRGRSDCDRPIAIELFDEEVDESLIGFNHATGNGGEGLEPQFDRVLGVTGDPEQAIGQKAGLVLG